MIGSKSSSVTVTQDAAMAILGDFAFFAGKPDSDLVRFKPESCEQDFIIMVPQSGEWAQLIEKCYGNKARKVTRYAIKKEKEIFDVPGLEQVTMSLPAEYELKMLEAAEFELCQKNAWAHDLISQYKDYDTYEKLGLGVVMLKDGELLAGASSYSRYNEGIEIEIDTREDQRRKGLAYACGAKLILECLKRGLYPSWDAQNKWSVALAEKLGYHFSHEYTAYEILGYQWERQSYSQIQLAAKQTIEYIGKVIKPGMSLMAIRKACEEKLLELGADSFWYWDVGAFVFAGDETTISVSGREYITSDRVIENNDIITIDLSPQIGNIWGDYARTIIVENGKVVGSVELIENQEWKSGLQMEDKLHGELLRFVTKETTFEELYDHMNRFIVENGFVNLDFMGNLGHSIVKNKEDRIYIEKGNQRKLGNVNYFTFEPHIAFPDSKYGYKKENIYYFDGDRLVEL